MKKLIVIIGMVVVAFGIGFYFSQAGIVNAVIDDGCDYGCKSVLWSAHRYDYKEDFKQYSEWSEWSSCLNNNSCSSADENAGLCQDTKSGCTGHGEMKRTRTLINEHACPSGYEYHEQSGPDDCRKLVETFGPITINYEKWDKDPNKCHRETANSLDVPSWAISKFNTDNPEHKPGERLVPEGMYLGEDNMCHSKTPVCGDESALNFDNDISSTEYVNNEVCEYDNEKPDPTPTPSPTPTPESLARKNFTSEARCDGRVYLRFTFKEEDGTGADEKTVKFTYNNQTKETKTNSEGRAFVNFAYAGEMQAKAEFDGQSKTTNVVAAENCGEVLGVSTGQVLGASTMAATGTFASSLYSLAGIAGMALTAVGMKRYGKKN